MPHVTVEQLNAWVEQTKMSFTEVDAALESQVSSMVIAKLAPTFDTASTWTDTTNTPQIVQDVIAMRYVGWYYHRTYSEDEDLSGYGERLLKESDNLIMGLLSGAIGIIEIPGSTAGQPAFYPNDASSAMEPTPEDPSLGPAKFTMGTIW